MSATSSFSSSSCRRPLPRDLITHPRTSCLHVWRAHPGHRCSTCWPAGARVPLRALCPRWLSFSWDTTPALELAELPRRHDQGRGRVDQALATAAVESFFRRRARCHGHGRAGRAPATVPTSSQPSSHRRAHLHGRGLPAELAAARTV